MFLILSQAPNRTAWLFSSFVFFSRHCLLSFFPFIFSIICISSILWILFASLLNVVEWRFCVLHPVYLVLKTFKLFFLLDSLAWFFCSFFLKSFLFFSFSLLVTFRWHFFLFFWPFNESICSQPGIPDASNFYLEIVNFLKRKNIPIQRCQNENERYPLEKGILKPPLVWKDMIVWFVWLEKIKNNSLRIQLGNTKFRFLIFWRMYTTTFTMHSFLAWKLNLHHERTSQLWPFSPLLAPGKAMAFKNWPPTSRYWRNGGRRKLHNQMRMATNKNFMSSLRML